MTEEEARALARDEVASFCGLALRRLQEVPYPARPIDVITALNEIFGEGLQQFGMGE